MERKTHHGIVYEPTAVLNPSPKVTNCCKSRWAKYSVQEAYMTQLVSPQLAPAMSRNPGKTVRGLNQVNNAFCIFPPHTHTRDVKLRIKCMNYLNINCKKTEVNSRSLLGGKNNLKLTCLHSSQPLSFLLALNYYSCGDSLR